MAGRLLAISDLHIGYPENRAYADALSPDDPGDWLIVAGDVGEVLADVGFVLASLANRFAKVIWTPGNHELWTLPSDPVALHGTARYEALVKVCRRFGVVTPEDEFPVWPGPGGPVTVAPLFTLYDYSFGAGGAVSGDARPAALSAARKAGITPVDEGRLHADPYPSVAEWCRDRVAAAARRLAAVEGPVVLASHWPLVRGPLAALRHQEFTPWCGTTLTADWHTRYPAAAAVYGHLHIPRTTRHDGVRFEEVSVGYPREWQRRGAAPPPPRVILEGALPVDAAARGAARWPAMSEHRDMALEALRSYDVAPLRVRLAAESFNSVFRVTTASAAYALRVGAALRIHPEGTTAVEAAWHQMLRRQGLGVPGVVANVDGALATLVTGSRAGDGPRVCVLFEWVAGRSLRARFSERRSAALGRLSARLHRDAAAWSPPGAGDVLAADRVLYWQLPERLSAAGARFGFGTLFADALARAQSAVDSLWRRPPHPPHLVHGDLTPANVIVSARDGLVPIDFQDTVRGFEVQDLSITVAALRRQPDGGRLAGAFRGGYSEARPWPDVSPALFESLIAARALHQMNLTLNTQDIGGLESYVTAHAERVRAWMRCPAGV
jgi:Ser/Thr protein kinase RdoA (MazF antagonist)/predicted phosphodiesterase